MLRIEYIISNDLNIFKLKFTRVISRILIRNSSNISNTRAIRLVKKKTSGISYMERTSRSIGMDGTVIGWTVRLRISHTCSLGTYVHMRNCNHHGMTAVKKKCVYFFYRQCRDTPWKRRRSICRSFGNKHVATISRYIALGTSLQRHFLSAGLLKAHGCNFSLTLLRSAGSCQIRAQDFEILCAVYLRFEAFD